jgi:hypothetical protein
MTDSIRATSGPIPFARKGEASPAVDRSAQSGVEVLHAPAQDLPTARLLAEKPRERTVPAGLTSLIRHVSHKGPARAANASAPALTYPSPWGAPAGAPAVVPRARPAEAPAQPSPGQLIHRTPPATRPSHVALEIDLHRRRQLTLRLTTVEFARFHIFARMTGSTYQDMLARAVRLFLAAMMPESTGVEDKAAVEPPTDTRHPHLRLLP